LEHQAACSSDDGTERRSKELFPWVNNVWQSDGRYGEMEAEHGDVIFLHVARLSGLVPLPVIHLLDESALLVMPDDVDWVEGMHSLHYGPQLEQALAGAEERDELVVELEHCDNFRQQVDMEWRQLSERWNVVQYKDVRRWLHACCRLGEWDKLTDKVGETGTL
jgi:hypothetical protein